MTYLSPLLREKSTLGTEYSSILSPRYNLLAFSEFYMGLYFVGTPRPPSYLKKMFYFHMVFMVIWGTQLNLGYKIS